MPPKSRALVAKTKAKRAKKIKTIVDPYPGHSALVSYLKHHTIWSFFEFLTLNRDVIVSSPPFSDEWNGLDGAWSHRFLREAQQLNPLTFETLKEKIASERSDNGLRVYWEEIIHHRKKLAVKRTHIIGSLDLLDVAGKHNVRDLVSEDFSKPFLAPPTITKNSEREEEDDVLYEDYEHDEHAAANSPRGTVTQRRALIVEGRSPFDVTFDEHIDTSSTNRGSREAALTSSKRKVASIDDDCNEPQSEDSVSEVPESDNESEYVPSDATSNEKLLQLLPSQLKCFAESHVRMDNSKKWVLSSGTCVEDKLLSAGNQLSSETLIHSWIIDLDNDETEKLFTEKEWREIKDEVCQQPNIDEYIAKQFSRFRNVRTTDDLRNVLAAGSSLIKIDFDNEWIELVMRRMLMHYEDRCEALNKSHLEGWYDVNVWSLIVDCCFSNVPGLETVRKESTSIAIGERKNRKRSRKERAKIGHRLDGILRTYDDNVEYGAMEVSKAFVKMNSTKQLEDGFKLAKTMHDMIVSLARAIQFNETKIRQLQLVGILHSGLKLQVFRMINPKGYVSLLKREQTQEIPKSIDKMMDLIRLLVNVWKAKRMVMNCMQVVKQEELSDITEEEFIQVILNNGVNASSISLPWSFDTPRSKRQQ